MKPSTTRFLWRAVLAVITLFLISAQGIPAPAAAISLPKRIINAPYFAVSDVGSQFNELAIFWFGKVSSTNNYSDVRIGYNDTTLYLHVATFDRRVWYDTTPTLKEMPQWDSVGIQIDTTGSAALKPQTSSYRFLTQYYKDRDPGPYHASYRGDGSAWVLGDIPFNFDPGWRGSGVNDNNDDRGRTMTLRIPFSSLGLNAPPAAGTRWKLGVTLYDRDRKAGPARTPSTWPEAQSITSPASWGELHFGLSSYTPPSAAMEGTATIRHKLNGAVVPDAAVGGTIPRLCPGSASYIWSRWGSDLYGAKPDFNIQNQVDVADWPCFAKYYVTFPLTSLPPGKVVLSAKLTLHQYGGSDPTQAKPSLIQVSSVGKSWSESTINWNNAPLAYENIAQTWVDPAGFTGWPGTPWIWDVSSAAAQAYAAHTPLRLVLYSADFDYHSGKFFSSSNTADWNAEARPTLNIEWGSPTP